MSNLDTAGSDVLYQAATGLETAMAEVDARRLLEVRAELITENWDAWKVQSRNLVFLAYAMGVTFWDDTWPETTKRQWVDNQFRFKAKVGTRRAIEMTLEIERHAGRDMDLVQCITPPQGMFLAGPPTKAEWDEYLARLPEIRVYVGHYEGVDDGGLYLDDGFLDTEFLTPDPGEAAAGRRATIHYPAGYNGIADEREVEMKVWHLETRTEHTGRVLLVERASIPGDAGLGLFLDDGFLDDGFFDGVGAQAKILTWEIDSAYDHTVSEFPVTVITPSLEPIVPRHERGSITGLAGAEMMLDADYFEDCYLGVDRADWLVFDRIRLFDPDVVAPLGTDGDFLDDARLGFPKYTAELLIHASRRAGEAEMFLDTDFLDNVFLVTDDLTLVERAFKGVTAAMALRDTILTTFDTVRQVQFADAARFDGSTAFDADTNKYL